MENINTHTTWADSKATGCDYFTTSLVVMFYEFIGTSMLVFAIILTRGDAFGVGATLFLALLLAGPVSGGHFNPAITLGVLINKQQSVNNWIQFCLMIIA